MAKIIENKIGRRSVRLSTDDIISVVREYQNFSCLVKNHEDIRFLLDSIDIYLPEDLS